MDTLYDQTNTLIQQTQYNFQLLEGNPKNAIEIESSIKENIDLINKNCTGLDLVLLKIPVDQRQNAKMRLDQLKYDNRHLQAALVAIGQTRTTREAVINERQQLLSRRFAPNQNITMIKIDYSIQHQNSLQNAHKGVDEMLHTGANALESLRSQRLTLKDGHRRIMDMANTLGLSNHTMGLIEKRASQDKIILILGMVITLVFILLITIYFT